MSLQSIKVKSENIRNQIEHTFNEKLILLQQLEKMDDADSATNFDRSLYDHIEHIFNQFSQYI